jgi:hypothetical protein
MRRAAVRWTVPARATRCGSSRRLRAFWSLTISPFQKYAPTSLSTPALDRPRSTRQAKAGSAVPSAREAKALAVAPHGSVPSGWAPFHLPHRPTLQAASHPTVRLLQEAWPLISALSAHAVWRQCNVVMDALSEVRLGVPDGGRPRLAASLTGGRCCCHTSSGVGLRRASVMRECARAAAVPRLSGRLAATLASCHATPRRVCVAVRRDACRRFTFAYSGSRFDRSGTFRCFCS